MIGSSIWRFSLVLLLGSVLLTTSARSEPVKLAVLLPLSNVNKFSGAQAKQGFEMGVRQQVAELGVDWDTWVTFEYLDTRSDKAHALELSKTAVAQGAKAILGLHSSAVTLHIQDYVLDTAKVPYVVFAGGVSSKIRRKHPLFIRVSNDAKMVMLPLASWLKEHPIVSSARPRWVCIYSDYTWGRTSCDAFKLGYQDVGDEIGRIPSPLKTVSKKQEIVELVKLQPDFAVAPFTGAEADVFLRDYYRFQVQKKIPLVMAGSAFTDRHLARYAQTLEQYGTGVGILHGDIYTPMLANEANRSFVTLR
jgi:ABC-type branched-subunit amino acid transport system substrate-binding protein